MSRLDVLVGLLVEELLGEVDKDEMVKSLAGEGYVGEGYVVEGYVVEGLMRDRLRVKLGWVYEDKELDAALEGR